VFVGRPKQVLNLLTG
jgi:hypothetical protein